MIDILHNHVNQLIFNKKNNYYGGKQVILLCELIDFFVCNKSHKSALYMLLKYSDVERNLKTLVFVLSIVMAGCAAAPDHEHIHSSGELCAALGMYHANRSTVDTERIKNMIRDRIKSGTFEISQKDCQEYALNSIAMMHIIQADSILI